MHQTLLHELTACVGKRWVLTNPADLHVYGYDGGVDRGVPAAVVLPGTGDEAARVLAILARHKQPFVSRGAATSMCGGPVPVTGAVVVPLTRLKGIGKVDREKREVRVEPGVVNLRLQEALAPHGLFFPPDPGSQKACTIGGNIGANAGGPHCLKYGVTSHYVNTLEVVLPDGKPAVLRVDDPGYDMVSLFVGSEGTLGVVTGARLKILPLPAQVRTMVAAFPTIEAAIQAVTDIISSGILPATLEAMDKTVVEAVEAFVGAGYPTDAEAVLLIEVDGDAPAALDGEVQSIRSVCARNGSSVFRFAADEAERQRLWEGRRGAYAAMARLAPNVLVEDGAVPRTALPAALREIKRIAAETGVRAALLFHAGDGNLHPQILFDERDADLTRVVREAGHRMMKACVDLGGTISGEHGIGSDKREAMKWIFSRETLQLFRRIKNAFDPDNLANPDKLIPLTARVVEPPASPVSEVSQLRKTGSINRPKDEGELIAMIMEFAREKRPFGIQGSGSRFSIPETALIDTTALTAVVDLDVDNLTLTAQAGARLADLRAQVEGAGRFLWIAGEGTLGGAIASRASVAPPLRDLILGMRVALSNGDVVRFGAKTMKNVAGYDAAKLLIGSFGTLGVIVDVTLRLFPHPAPELRAADEVRPFLMRPLHKTVKQAFDPGGILALQTSALTADQIKNLPSGPPPPRPRVDLDNFSDRFWV